MRIWNPATVFTRVSDDEIDVNLGSIAAVDDILRAGIPVRFNQNNGAYDYAIITAQTTKISKAFLFLVQENTAQVIYYSGFNEFATSLAALGLTAPADTGYTFTVQRGDHALPSEHAVGAAEKTGAYTLLEVSYLTGDGLRYYISNAINAAVPGVPLSFTSMVTGSSFSATTPGNKFSIDGTTITLSGTTLGSVITDITTAAIPNITASNFGGNLRIVDSTGAAIVLANVLGTPLANLGLTPGSFTGGGDPITPVGYTQYIPGSPAINTFNLDTSRLINLCGAPFTGSYDALQTGPAEKVVIERFLLSGNYATTATNDVLGDDYQLYPFWVRPKAKMVQFTWNLKTEDTGVNKDKLNVVLGGSAVFSINANAGYDMLVGPGTSASADLYVAAYSVDYSLIGSPDFITFSTNAGGSNKDAADLTAQLTFILE